MGRDATQYTDEWFETRGYTFNESSNTWIPPVLKSAYIRQQEAVNNGDSPRSTVEIYQEKMVIPDVKLKTEWFISGNVVPKKNSRINFVRNGKQISIPSKAHKEYVAQTKSQYQTFGREFLNAVKVMGLEYPLWVEFAFIRKSKHRSDFTNLVQSCEDLMTEHGWIPDDDLLHLLPVPFPVQYDKNNSGVRIKLLIK